MHHDQHTCDAHDERHQHGPGCGHERVRHEDHWDYLVDSHLHHVVDGRCAYHGVAQLDTAAG